MQNITTKLKHDIGTSLITGIGLLPHNSALRAMIVPTNGAAKAQLEGLKEGFASADEAKDILIESFIKDCLVEEEKLIVWVKENETMLKQSQSLILKVLLNALREAGKI